MYLTKIRLDLRNSGMRRAAADCQQLHRLVTGLFRASRQDARILYRLRSAGISSDLYLYSDIPVNRECVLPGMTLLGERDVTAWVDSMTEGRVVGFDLVAFPNKKTPEDGVKSSRRHLLRTEEERVSWLCRKGEQFGFSLLGAEELEAVRITGKHANEQGGAFTVDAYHYQGTLRIEDAEKFRTALCGGIGPGKAYGLGMLLLN